MFCLFYVLFCIWYRTNVNIRKYTICCKLDLRSCMFANVHPFFSWICLLIWFCFKYENNSIFAIKWPLVRHSWINRNISSRIRMLKSQFRIIRNRFQFVISTCQMKLEFWNLKVQKGTKWKRTKCAWYKNLLEQWWYVPFVFICYFDEDQRHVPLVLLLSTTNSPRLQLLFLLTQEHLYNIIYVSSMYT